MHKIVTYIILAAVFFSGVWLLYRSVFQVDDIKTIEGKVIGKAVERLYEHKGTSYYAATFRLENESYRPGIYTGSDSVHQLISKIDTGDVYTFLMDASIATSKDVNLGVREIRLKDAVIYKESNRSSLLGGIALILISLLAMVLLWKYNNRLKPPVPNVSFRV